MDRYGYLLGLVEQSIKRFICAPGKDHSVVVSGATYHLHAGGARIRALICLHASQQLGLSDDTSVVLATTCELLHNASLVQDDVFDRETMRRGVESVWELFGETVAICAGDLMLSAAFAVIAELPDSRLVASAIQLVFRHTRSVIVGQGTEKDALPATLAEYEALAIGKSASLLTLPLQLALMASYHDSSMNLAQRVAEAFAIAYQINDDFEDYQQDQQAGSLNVLSVLCSRDGLDLGQARTIAATRAVELLHRCIGDATVLPRDCAAVMVNHATKMLVDIEASLVITIMNSRNMQHAG